MLRRLWNDNGAFEAYVSNDHMLVILYFFFLLETEQSLVLRRTKKVIFLTGLVMNLVSVVKDEWRSIPGSHLEVFDA